MSARAKPAAWLATAIAVLALVEAGLGLWQPRRIATDADWRAAAAVVERELGADDLVVFAPRWIDPVGRQHLGRRMPVEMIARADEARYARIWELSVHGARADETATLAPALEQRFGALTLRRYDKPSERVLIDLTARFAEARVATEPRGGGEARPCPVEGEQARRCGAIRVEPRVMEIAYRPRRGILVPVTSGERFSIEYEALPAGRLVGYVGLHDYYARKNADGVVLFRARVDEAQAVMIPVRNPPPDGDGWQRFELELGPGEHRVRFELESERPAHRLPGFHAEVRAR